MPYAASLDDASQAARRDGNGSEQGGAWFRQCHADRERVGATAQLLLPGQEVESVSDSVAVGVGQGVFAEGAFPDFEVLAVDFPIVVEVSREWTGNGNEGKGHEVLQ